MGIDPRSGCCIKGHQDTMEQYSCKGCQGSSECCNHYEICVSCCMGVFQDNPQAIKGQSTLEETEQTSLFDDCQYACRTSSKSIIDHNQYRHDEYKHCYGSQHALKVERTATADEEYFTLPSVKLPPNNSGFLKSYSTWVIHDSYGATPHSHEIDQEDDYENNYFLPTESVASSVHKNSLFATVTFIVYLLFQILND